MVACCEMGKSPAFCADTATPAGRVHVQDADDVGPRRVDRAVDDEARRVHRVGARRHLRAVGVDLHEARRGDLVEEHPVGIDEEVVRGARQARRDVREDQVVPPEERDEAIAGGQIDAKPAFGDVLRLVP